MATPAQQHRSSQHVRRVLGKLRRSATLIRATNYLAIQGRRAQQRLRARFVQGVWLRTDDYLATLPPSLAAASSRVVEPAAHTAIAAPTYVSALPAQRAGHALSVQVPPGRAHLLPRAWVVGHSGAVIAQDRRLLWDLSYEWPGRPQSHTVYRLGPFPAEELAGLTATLAAMAAEANYFHFLLNSVARLAYLQRVADFGQPERYLVSGRVTPFVAEAFALFGIPADRLIGNDDHAAIRTERLLAPSLVHHPFIVPAHVCEFLRTTALAALPPRGPRRRRLFIDRSDAGTRRIRNLDALAPLLASAGIERVRLGGLSLAGQAALFNEAELVIANHGAALSNLVFCDPGTRVLQVLAPGMTEREYRTIAQHLGLRHDYFVGEFATPDDARLPRKHRDLAVPPALLRQILADEGWL